jgi:hypothetical protein
MGALHLSFSLSVNAIGPRTLQVLATVLPDTQMTYMNISGEYSLGIPLTRWICRSIDGLIIILSTLPFFVCSPITGNGLTLPEEIAATVASFYQKTNLKTLDLSGT